jgi:methionyl-tRNA formyltransferase
MTVLILCPEWNHENLVGALAGDDWCWTDRPLTPAYVKDCRAEFLLSCGYRFLIRPEILAMFRPGFAINCHISLLPWNRGADPNLWSWIDGTPKGVTIHGLDEDLDTGPILIQDDWTASLHGKAESPEWHETLATTYSELHYRMTWLLRNHWKAGPGTLRVKGPGADPATALRDGSILSTPQPPGGTSHTTKDRARAEAMFPEFKTLGWQTPLSVFLDYGAESAATRDCFAREDEEMRS